MGGLPECRALAGGAGGGPSVENLGSEVGLGHGSGQRQRRHSSHPFCEPGSWEGAFVSIPHPRATALPRGSVDGEGFLPGAERGMETHLRRGFENTGSLIIPKGRDSLPFLGAMT